MLGNVSWGQFLTGVAILLVVYYLIVGVLLRQNIAAFLSKLRKNNNTAGADNEKSNASEEPAVEQLERIVGDLRVKVFSPLGHDASKEEVMYLLRQQLATYAEIKKRASSYALGNAITQLAAEMCGVHIDENDLATLWHKI